MSEVPETPSSDEIPATPSTSDDFLANLNLKPVSWNLAKVQGVEPWSAPQSFKSAMSRCLAISRQSGEPCNKYAPKGSKYCRQHGGPKPDALLLEAKEKMRGLALEAVERLGACLAAGPACPTCGRSDNDRDPTVVRAAQIVLDRSGIGPTTTLAVGPAGDLLEQAWLSYLTEEEQETMARIVALAKEREAKAAREEDA